MLKNNPPTAKHAAAVEPFKYIGLIPGQVFDPEQLSPSTKAGLIRAAQMGEQIMQWKVKFRGTPYETRWNKLREGTYDFDYLDRAAGSLEGLFVHDYVEAMYYSTYESYVPPAEGDQTGQGAFFDSSHQYVLHFEADELPKTKENGFWSVTMYGADFQLVDNEINLYSISERTEGVTKNDDGSLDIYVQSERPDDPQKACNWLPCPREGGQLFRLNYRIYLPDYRVQHPDDDLSFIPPVLKCSLTESV